MLDDNNRGSSTDKPFEDSEKSIEVFRVQTGRGFIQYD
jgi:hypothetical protein